MSEIVDGKVLVLVALISLFSLTSIHAQPFPSNFGDLDIEHNAFNSLPQNVAHNFTFYVSNKTALINDATCFFNLDYRNGTNIFKANTSSSINPNEYYFDLSAGNFSFLGENSVIVHCNNSNQAGGISFTYDITPTGRAPPSTGESLVYLASLSVMFLFSLLFFLISWSFKYQRETRKERTNGQLGSEDVLERGNPAMMFGFMGASFVTSIITIFYAQIGLRDGFSGFNGVSSAYQVFFYVILLIMVIILMLLLVVVIMQSIDTFRTQRGKNPNRDPY